MEERLEGLRMRRCLVRREKRQFVATVRSVSEIHDRSRLTSSSRSIFCLKFFEKQGHLGEKLEPR